MDVRTIERTGPIGIAVLPGDEIGPELTAQSVKVLHAAAGNRFDLHMTEAPIGQAEVDASGVPLPDATMELARGSDAILFGSVGGPTDEVGYLILRAEGVFDIDTVLAGILLLAVVALLLDGAVSWIERKLLRWRAPVQVRTQQG